MNATKAQCDCPQPAACSPLFRRVAASVGEGGGGTIDDHFEIGLAEQGLGGGPDGIHGHLGGRGEHQLGPQFQL